MTKQMSPIQASQILQSLAQNDNVMSYLLGRVTGDPEEAFRVAIAALREKAERERGCAYCVIGKRSPDAEYCSNCGRKLTPTLPELANESEEVNQDSRQYLDNDSTYRRKSVKQMGRNLYSETAETCTLRCEYCGKYTQDSDLSTEWVGDKYLMCSKCKEKHT